jgi:two-component system nitrogen regulation response regulator GlnG
LFLDEVGNTPAAVQPMLLRVLETGDYRPLGATRDQHSNARLIAATDQNLHAAGFNQALLRRLEGFIILLTPLRGRREDIGSLLIHLLATEGDANIAFPPALAARFVRYDWPGNVRQMKLVFRRCLLALQAGEMPDFDALVGPGPVQPSPAPVAPYRAGQHPPEEAGAMPEEGAAARPARRKLLEVDPQDVVRAMDDNRWYIQGAAQALGISRPSMYKLLEGHATIRPATGIDAAEIRSALVACGGDLEACAARLKTPTEALRRHLRSLA